MLVYVLMIFVVFSFTGVAVLNVSYVSTLASAETVNNIKLQYAMESSVNESLWRMNNGPDSLINLETDEIITNFNPDLNVLSVKIDKFQMESEILLNLSEDTHFDRAIASNEEIETNGYETDNDPENNSRQFTFLPEVDLEYFMDNAVAIHSENFQKFEGKKGKGKGKQGKSKNGKGKSKYTDLDLEDGIHVFTGSYLEFKNVTLENHTLVFTGRYISFNERNQINAHNSLDSSEALPALVFTNPNSFFEIEAEGKRYEKEDIITGAIYSAGSIVLKKGQVSGPIVGNTITLRAGHDHRNHIEFTDTEHPQHYRWQKGFKGKDYYDWPKQIGHWKTKMWRKKHKRA